MHGDTADWPGHGGRMGRSWWRAAPRDRHRAGRWARVEEDGRHLRLPRRIAILVTGTTEPARQSGRRQGDARSAQEEGSLMTAVAPPPGRPPSAPEPAPALPAGASRPTVEPTDAPVLTCKGLRKRFGDRVAVDGVGFEIRHGETYGLLGPNGAGKTTTISMICGILAADGGDVRGRRQAGRPRDRRGQGRDRLRAPGPRDLPGPQRPREPDLLRAAVRPGRRQAARADRRGPRRHRPRGLGRTSGPSSSRAA